MKQISGYLLIGPSWDSETMGVACESIEGKCQEHFTLPQSPFTFQFFHCLKSLCSYSFQTQACSLCQ